jgi:hypothetical protein
MSDLGRETGCRDCSRCTDSFATNVVLAPWHVLGGIVGGLTVNLFKRSCPECKHLMQYHQKIEERFAD